jgi:uncharacterized protein (TIGR02996 family)
MPGVEEQGFLGAIEENPQDVATRLAYADWLEEHQRSYEAMLQRVEAGVSEARYKVRRKSDGLFSEGGSSNVQFSSGGAEWKKASSVRAHLTQNAPGKLYGGNTPWEDVEVVVYEVRTHFIGTLPYSFKQPEKSWRWRTIIVHEPQGPTDDSPAR